MKSDTIELVGILGREKWRKAILPGEDTDHFVIAVLESGETVKGIAPRDNFEPGGTYRFFGAWEQPNPKYGPTFKFSSYAQAEPHSRRGLIKYLEKYANGIGPALASRIFDRYGQKSCAMLRDKPEEVVAEIQGLSIDRAKEASASLRKKSKFEDTRIALTNLLDGRGFHGSIYDKLIQAFGALAPQRIKRDPFCLLVHGFPGAGFKRCDRLYLELGKPPGARKRQMLCLWHALSEDRAGHTWHKYQDLNTVLRNSIGSTAPNLAKAVELGCRANWLAIRRDTSGTIWVAEFKKAESERTVAECVAAIIDGPAVLPLFTEPRPGECDQSEDDCEELIAEILEQRERAAEIAAMASQDEYQDEDPEEFGDPRKTDPQGLVKVGRRLGICQFCGRVLMTRESKFHGYGPVCAAKHGLPWGDVPGPTEVRGPASGLALVSMPPSQAALEAPAEFVADFGDPMGAELLSVGAVTSEDI